MEYSKRIHMDTGQNLLAPRGMEPQTLLLWADGAANPPNYMPDPTLGWP